MADFIKPVVYANFAAKAFTDACYNKQQFSGKDFYLTGSHFFQPEKITRSTDVDLFIEDNKLFDKQFFKNLENYGFAIPDPWEYCDMLTRIVVRNLELGLDIQIVLSTEEKLRKQTKLQKWGKLYNFSKIIRKDLWDLA